MMENWEIKVLEHWLVDYNAWAINAVNEGVFPDNNTALESKVALRLPYTIKEYEEKNGSFEQGLSDEEKINIIISQPGYKNRAERDAEDFARLQI